MPKSPSRRSSVDGGNNRPPKTSQSKDGFPLDVTLPADVAMERILVKLELLDYRSHFCKDKKPYRSPLHPLFFAMPPNAITTGQFPYFSQLVAWMLGRLGRSVTIPKEFDDPAVICTNLMNEMKQLGFASASFSISKLHKGFGPEVCCVLDALLNRIIARECITLAPTIYPTAKIEAKEDPDDIEDVDLTLDEVRSDDESSVDENVPNVEDCCQMTDLEAATNAASWREETARIASELKIDVTDEPQDWRYLLTNARFSLEEICQVWEDVEKQSESLTRDISHQLQNIKAKEDLINQRFKTHINQHAQRHKNLTHLHAEIAKGSTEIDALEQEEEKVEKSLAHVVAQIEAKTTSLSDATPVVRLKEAIDTMRQEVSEMKISISLMSHSLLQFSSESQRAGWISSDED